VTPLTLPQWRAVGLAACLATLVVVVFSTRSLRQTEAQLAAVTHALDSVTTQLDSARGIARQMAADRQALRDSIRVEQVIRDSLYRVASARRVEIRRWRETVEALQLSVVDTLPVLDQNTILRREVQTLRAAGDLTAVALEQQTQTIEDLRMSDLRQRERADSADARAVRAEADLAAQLTQARAGVQQAITAARRPWYRRALGGLKTVGEKAVVAVPAYLLGRLT
jgi:hypothetical protein